MSQLRREELSVRRVRSVLSVVTNGSFSRAAEELCLTQPAISQHVRQLEDQLGVALLVRNLEGIQLSPAGTALLPAFRHFVSSNYTILDQLASLSHGTKQILRIASPASFAALHISRALDTVRIDYPDHVLDISEIDDEKTFELIRAGDIDFGISSVFVPSAGLKSEPIHKDRACIVVSKQNPLYQKSVIAVEALLDQRLIRFPIGTTSNNWLTTMIESAGKTPTIISEVRQLLTGLHMVRQNMGIVVLPEDAAIACQLPDTKHIPINDPSLVRVLSMITSESHHPTEFEQVLVAQIRINTESGICSSN